MTNRMILQVVILLTVLVPSLSASAAPPRAYVANLFDGTVSVIDTGANTVISTIPVGSLPNSVVINPAGTFVYVNAGYGLSVIDTSSNEVVATVPVDAFGGIVINPQGTYVYAGSSRYGSIDMNSVCGSISSTISVIDAAANKVVASIASGPNQTGELKTNAEGTDVYVAGCEGLSVIDTKSNGVAATIPVGFGGISAMALNPAGLYVYATNKYSNTVAVVNAVTNIVVATVPVENGPGALAVNPAGTRLYVANGGSNTVSIIDTGTDTVVATVPVGNVPKAMVLNPGGSRLYVANSDSVSVIDAINNTVVTTVPVGDSINSMAVNPAGTYVYVVNGVSYNGISNSYVSVIDTNTNNVVTTVPGGLIPLGIAIGGPARAFFDVPSDHWAYSYIDAIYKAGITQGCGFGDYCPSENVIRDQAAAFMVRATQVAAGQGSENFTCNGNVDCSATTPYFSDVSSTNAFFKYTQKLKELGITAGCGNGNYCPANNVTRDQMAAFIVRATQVALGQGPESFSCNGNVDCSTTMPYFNDVPSINSFFKYIQKLKELGITTGCGNGNYCPSEDVTRDQMAAFLARAFLGMK